MVVLHLLMSEIWRIAIYMRAALEGPRGPSPPKISCTITFYALVETFTLNLLSNYLFINNNMVVSLAQLEELIFSLCSNIDM